MTLANYAMKLEREVWGVLEGPWGSDTWMGWRRDWAQRVLMPLLSSAFLMNPVLVHSAHTAIFIVSLSSTLSCQLSCSMLSH